MTRPTLGAPTPCRCALENRARTFLIFFCEGRSKPLIPDVRRAHPARDGGETYDPGSRAACSVRNDSCSSSTEPDPGCQVSHFKTYRFWAHLVFGMRGESQRRKTAAWGKAAVSVGLREGERECLNDETHNRRPHPPLLCCGTQGWNLSDLFLRRSLEVR